MEISFGIVPVRQSTGIWQVLLVQHKQGHWSFPKGHVEDEESHLETATRELFEETHLHIQQLLCDEPFYETYRFQKSGKDVEKRVGYFIAEVTGNEIIDKKELASSCWTTFDQAEQIITFPESKRILHKAKNFLIDKL